MQHGGVSTFSHHDAESPLGFSVEASLSSLFLKGAIWKACASNCFKRNGASRPVLHRVSPGTRRNSSPSPLMRLAPKRARLQVHSSGTAQAVRCYSAYRLVPAANSSPSPLMRLAPKRARLQVHSSGTAQAVRCYSAYRLVPAANSSPSPLMRLSENPGPTCRLLEKPSECR
jgi:hypothetical protein